jgi:hypothetical protein
VATASNVLGRADLVDLWRAGGAAQSVSFDFPSPNHYVQAVAAGDFDNDGKDDLVVAYRSLEQEVWYSAVDIFYPRSGGKWERRSLYREATREGVTALASGHLRGPGPRDLVALTMRGETLVYLGDGHGGFVRNTESIPAHETCRGAHGELADLDGDGRDEIVASFADEDQGCPSGGAITAWKLRPAK